MEIQKGIDIQKAENFPMPKMKKKKRRSEFYSGAFANKLISFCYIGLFVKETY